MEEQDSRNIMAEAEPPVLPVPEAKSERYQGLRAKFREHFKDDPLFLARAPGRVNLIGEHIDYCGYSVFPMAIEQDIVMAVLPDNSGKITLVNSNPKYDGFHGEVKTFEITKDVPHWYKYVLCGIRGIKEQFSGTEANGFKALVDGTIPQSAGLSSSSALVCCAALAMLKANGWSMTKEQLSEVCAKCERHIGTEGGGMDQAISFTAKAGRAKLIEFNPLRTTDVQLPIDSAFVVSNSLAEMNKAATPHFNIRVVECRIAAQILAQSQPGIHWKEIRRLGELQAKLGVSLDDMLSLVNSELHIEPYSKDEVCKILEVSPEELAETSLSSNTQNVEKFYLHQRARHVYGEAKRVLHFKAVCDEQPSDALAQLGELMNASHVSCRDLYECSHPDLDILVETCKENGAVGSRMTGAGWGGCAVSIVKSDSVLPLLTGVRDSYYTPNPARKAKVQEALFATTPGAGAAYYTFE
jgi:N-acetylgalactosamine kinase